MCAKWMSVMIYEASVKAPGGPLQFVLVEGAFCLAVRAKPLLSTNFTSYFSSCEKEKETRVSGRSKQLRNGFLACEESEVAMLFCARPPVCREPAGVTDTDVTQ